MTERFYGPWALVVVHVATGWELELERFLIAGSDTSDGTYPGVVGNDVMTVSGTEWTLALERRIIGATAWWPQDTLRSPAYTLADGLTVLVTGDLPGDSHPAGLTILCRSLDPELNPVQPFTNPYDFTVPRDVKDRYRRRRAFRQAIPRPERTRQAVPRPERGPDRPRADHPHRPARESLE